VTEAENWWHFALGPHRERIWARLREIDTRIIRIFLFDKQAPDPVTDWESFAAYIQAVRNVGATPMVTFAKFHRPFDDPRAVRWFAERCADVVWGCIDQWGGEVVRDWYWCVWNEPNSAWIGGGLSFEQYRRIYEEVAQRICRWLGPYLAGRKPLIGGPAINGFLPFWTDWVWEFLNEIDESLIGFVDWHCYGDWREGGEWAAPRDEAAHQALIMFKTVEYEDRARMVDGLLRGRGIRNVCGELNAHSHHDARVSGPFNRTVFGATFYVSALLHLIKGGAHAELFWTGTDATGRYGMLNADGSPTPLFHAKRLCARYVRLGDRISFPIPPHPSVDVLVARGDETRRSALFVHTSDEAVRCAVDGVVGGLSGAPVLLKMDRSTGGRVVKGRYDGAVSFEGYGIAAVTNGESHEQ
jgi:hypothetical protein